MDKHYVYLVENEINHKIYVGMTSNTPTHRFKQHVSNARAGSEHTIHRAIRKYGAQNFTVFSYKTFDTRRGALMGEREAIEFFDTFLGCGYNETPGGENQTSGANSPRTSTTEKQVREIRIKHKNGASLNELGKKYNLDFSSISLYVRGKRFANAGGPIKGRDYEDDKLSNEEIRQIRQRCKNGAVKTKLAKEYNVGRQTIYNYMKGKTRVEAVGVHGEGG